MALVRALGRLLLSGQFLIGGFEAAREPGGRVDAAARLGLPNPELMVRVNGAAMVLGGALLALGIRPKLAAGILGLCLIPTTYAGHAFWAQEDASGRRQQKTHFFKNAAMLGGLALVLADNTRRR